MLNNKLFDSDLINLPSKEFLPFWWTTQSDFEVEMCEGGAAPEKGAMGKDVKALEGLTRIIDIRDHLTEGEGGDSSIQRSGIYGVG